MAGPNLNMSLDELIQLRQTKEFGKYRKREGKFSGEKKFRHTEAAGGKKPSFRPIRRVLGHLTPPSQARMKTIQKSSSELGFK